MISPALPGCQDDGDVDEYEYSEDDTDDDYHDLTGIARLSRTLLVRRTVTITVPPIKAYLSMIMIMMMIVMMMMEMVVMMMVMVMMIVITIMDCHYHCAPD